MFHDILVLLAERWTIKMKIESQKSEKYELRDSERLYIIKGVR